MDWACGQQWGNKKCIQSFGGEFFWKTCIWKNEKVIGG